MSDATCKSTAAPLSGADMDAAILDYVRKKGGGVSFVELCRDIPGFEGNLVLCLGGDPNLALWLHVSSEASAAISRLASGNFIRVKPTVPLVYWIDGAVPNLPVAKSVRKHKRPHWLPVSIDIGKRGAK